MIIWSTVAVLLTLAIFSKVFKDNVVYKFAESLFVGVMVGYTVVVTYTQIILRKLVDPLNAAFKAHDVGMIIALIIATLIGMLYLSRFSQKAAWVSRYPIAITIGYWAGYGILVTFQSTILIQTYSTVVDTQTGDALLSGAKIAQFFKSPTFANFMNAINGPILVFGVLVVLIYFFFSFKNTNPVIRFSNKPALVYLMIAFGASFGYTFMARISLFIGRINFIMRDWWPLFKKAVGI